MEAGIEISGNSINKVLLKEVEITAETVGEYSRLTFPLQFKLRPVPMHDGIPLKFVITSITGSLAINGIQGQLSDSIINRVFEVTSPHEWSATETLVFPLDRGRINRIEQSRQGDLSGGVSLTLTIGKYRNFENESDNFLIGFQSIPSHIQFKVPQSHWVQKVLPNLGYGKFHLFEFELSKLFGKFIADSVNELKEAQKYFQNHDYDKTVAHCRSAIEPVRSQMDKIKEILQSESESRWCNAVGVGTFEWLDRALKATNGITSKTHHSPATGHFGRFEAESILMITCGFIYYASGVLNTSV